MMIMRYLHVKCMKTQEKILWCQFLMFLTKIHIIECTKVHIKQWIYYEESQLFKFFMKIKDFECLKDLFLEKSKILTILLNRFLIKNFIIKSYIAFIFLKINN